MKKTVLILGASSEIGLALAKYLSEQGCLVLMAARNTLDLEIRLKSSEYDGCQVLPFEATDFNGHTTWFNLLPEIPNLTICLFGYLGDQKKAESDWSEANNIIESNYTGAVSILNVVANSYSKRKSGTIVGFSSVAGERGRQSNFIYGSAKAGFTAYLSGLRNRLFTQGVHVMTVLPGFMDTKMTRDMNLPKALTAKPDEVAKLILKAIDRKKNVVYVLSIWFWVMLVIKLIPEFIFKRLKL